MSTAAIETAAKPEVLLIDLSALFWSAWHSSGADEISQARMRTIESVQRCIADRHDRLVAICCDSGRSFRKDLYPEYKANRPEKDHATLGELDQVKAKLVAQGFLLWEAKGFEADDIIATATERAVEAGHEVLIASGDKDLLQLVSEAVGVRALRTHNWTVVGEREVKARFGVSPEQLGDWLALVGDKADNIPGCPGVGDKRATELLQKHPSLDAIWEALEINSSAVSTPAIVKSLLASKEAVTLARRLIRLNGQAPVEFEQIYEERRAATATEDIDMDTPAAEYSDPISKGPGVAPGPAPAQEATAEAPPANGAPKATTVQAEVMTTAIGPALAFELQLEPTSLGTAWNLAKALYESRLYTRFPTPQAIMAVIIRGREMGLGALTSLDVFHMIEGKPAPHAHFLIARAEAHRDCEWFQCIHTDSLYAEYETKNRKHSEPFKHRYTIEDAIDAGLCGKDIIPRTAGKGQKDERGNWDKRRAEMLRKTAGVQLGRIVYPAAIMGLYSVEELGGE